MADRRGAVPFDPGYFGRRAAQGDRLDPTAAFRHAYRSNLWGDPESVSGPGSGREQTARLRAELPALLQSLGVTRLLDLPCGDGAWMAAVDLAGATYIGGDLLPELVEENRRRQPGRGREFRVLDLTASELPAADLLLCRDCLVHLSFADAARAVANIRRARITYLLTTTFPDEATNLDIVSGDWRPLNLERPPFGFAPPLLVLNEGCTEGGGRFADKSLGLWRCADLPERLPGG